MFIIAGAGEQKSKKHITRKTIHCYRCNNDSYWILEQRKSFVSLFFVPVVPYKTQYLFYCSICGNNATIDKDSFERKIKFEANPYQSNT